MNKELKIFAAFVAVFLIAYFLPLASPQFSPETSPVNARATKAIIAGHLLDRPCLGL